MTTTVILRFKCTYRLLAYYGIQGGPDDGREIAIAYPLAFASDPEGRARSQRATDDLRAHTTAADDIANWMFEQDAAARPCIAYRRRTYAPETIVAAEHEVECLRAKWQTEPKLEVLTPAAPVGA